MRGAHAADARGAFQLELGVIDLAANAVHQIEQHSLLCAGGQLRIAVTVHAAACGRGQLCLHIGREQVDTVITRVRRLALMVEEGAVSRYGLAEDPAGIEAQFRDLFLCQSLRQARIPRPVASLHHGHQ